MRALTAVVLVGAFAFPGIALGSEAGDELAQRLYDGTLAEAYDSNSQLCDAGESDACFAAGLTDLIGGVEGLSQAFYRHGAASPGVPAAAMLLGMAMFDEPEGPANPNPEPLSYEQLRDILGGFVASLDQARLSFELAGEGGDYVLTIDPLRVRIDLDGNGTAEAHETLGTLLASLGDFGVGPGPSTSGKTKPGAQTAPDTSVGFDRADAIWFAGYTQIAVAPVDLLLAHDFSEFFDAYMHRVFPEAGLPMQPYSRGGTLMMDADSDAMIFDLIAAIHTVDFPVTDAQRLAGVLARLKSITALSRQNWQAVLAETDDNMELVPSPAQTSILPDMVVTEETVAAWMSTLDTLDEILDGELLVPHWRFSKGFDLKAYFETAQETDLVMLLAGQGALPFLKDGPVAEAQSFADANRVFGGNWINYAVWFN